jgi:hypothetical protein
LKSRCSRIAYNFSPPVPNQIGRIDIAPELIFSTPPKEFAMKKEITCARRQFIKIGCAAMTVIPLLALADKAAAASNEGLRNAMKYQNNPSGEKACGGCLLFVSGKSAKALGGCKLFPGDAEISPTGYCVAWAAKPN